MFQQWIKNLQAGKTASAEPERFYVERLSALLLIEIARSDTSIDESEVDAIGDALQASEMSIDPSEIADIVAGAKKEVETTVSLHGHIREINQVFSREQKILLVEQMWRVAFADGDLDKYEESMIRKLCGLIHVGHQEYIQAKLRVAS